MKMKTRLLIIIGIFLIIFGVDGILFLDSAIPECRGFTGTGLFVFVTLGFDSRAIMSNPDCLVSFYSQIISGMLFIIGLSMISYILIKRQNRVQCKQEITD